MADFLLQSCGADGTYPAVFRHPQGNRWEHRFRVDELILDEAGLHRKGVNESLKGVIYYVGGNVPDRHDFTVKNMETIVASGVPCWPDPRTC
jgi:hypothetical protein